MLATIQYKKLFLSGLLEGLTVDCTVTRVEPSSAYKWGAGTVGRDVLTKSRYVILKSGIIQLFSR